MAKEEVLSILSKLLLGLQLCLGIWQTCKLTPVGAVMKGIIGWILRPLGLSPVYAWLHSSPGRVFKMVRCIKMLPPDETRASPWRRSDTTEIRSSYLGVPFHLERKGNRLFVDGKMAYYITDVNWDFLEGMNSWLTDNRFTAVFLKNYKQFWEQVATGRVLSFSELLDCFIVECYDYMPSDYNEWILPVDLSVSEEKLLKLINLGGLFVQAKNANGVAGTVLSLTSAVLEFNAPLREWIYGKINLVFCWLMRYSTRKQVYSLGNWVHNLKPSNEVELRVGKRDRICAVIGGGAKAHKEGATLVPWLSCPESQTTFNFNCGHLNILCELDPDSHRVVISINMGDRMIGHRRIICKEGSRTEFIEISTFMSRLAENRCGSLKCYGPNNKVHVRNLLESIEAYRLNGNPPVYELVLQDVIVQ